MSSLADPPAPPATGVWKRRPVVLIALLAALLLAGLTPFVLEPGPRGLVRSVPLPRWLESLTQQDQLMFSFHAGLGGFLNTLHVQPVAAASEWFKAAHHATTDAQLEQIATGIATAETRTSAAQLEATLCPFVAGWSDSIGWGARGRQLYALSRANLTCGDYASTVFGTVPDDVPVAYPASPPSSGVYHESWYPTYGVAAEHVPPAAWVHNLAHGEIVLLYHCPRGCADALAQAAQLQRDMPPGANPNGPGARMIITGYDDLSTPFAVVAWGVMLPLDHFDADRIAAFYSDHVDRGVECRNLHC